MGYDEDLAQRIRALVGNERGLTEKKLFGGRAFLIGRKMALAASGRGGILVRVVRARSDQLVATSHASVAVMGGRPMPSRLRVDARELRTPPRLKRWVDLRVGFARSIPPKGQSPSISLPARS